MIENGFCRNNFDSCVYYKQVEENMIYLLLYVEDMLITCKERKHIDNVKCMLKSKFEMKKLGHAKRILGLVFNRDRKNKIMYLSQKSYFSKVLNESIENM